MLGELFGSGPDTTGQQDQPAGPSLKDQWDSFLGNPMNRAAMLSAGISLLTPQWGGLGANIGQAIGAGAEAAAATEKQMVADADFEDAARAKAAGAARSSKEKALDRASREKIAKLKLAASSGPDSFKWKNAKASYIKSRLNALQKIEKDKEKAFNENLANTGKKYQGQSYEALRAQAEAEAQEYLGGGPSDVGDTTGGGRAGMPNERGSSPLLGAVPPAGGGSAGPSVSPPVAARTPPMPTAPSPTPPSVPGTTFTPGTSPYQTGSIATPQAPPQPAAPDIKHQYPAQAQATKGVAPYAMPGLAGRTGAFAIAPPLAEGTPQAQGGPSQEPVPQVIEMDKKQMVDLWTNRYKQGIWDDKTAKKKAVEFVDKLYERLKDPKYRNDLLYKYGRKFKELDYSKEPGSAPGTQKNPSPYYIYNKPDMTPVGGYFRYDGSIYRKDADGAIWYGYDTGQEEASTF